MATQIHIVPQCFYWSFGDGSVRWAGEETTPLHQHRFRVGEIKYSEALELALPDELADLVTIARCVYISDRISQRTRRAFERPALSRRHLRISIPVTNPDRWNSSELNTSLCHVLEEFTDDRWDLHFTRKIPAPPIAFQQSLFPNPDTYSRLALFSGGLDSFAGLCNELEEGRRIALSGVVTSSRVGHKQHTLAREVRRISKSRVGWIPFSLGLEERVPRAYRYEETSQRSRGFVFGTLGAVTALMIGLDHVAVYENGIGALNLRYSDAQVGVMLTRATNPLVLHRLGNMISAATERPLHFELPFLFRTKAEMCRGILSPELRGLIHHTISCDGFPQRVAGQEQCGLCTSCILRRQSLLVSSLGCYDHLPYRFDVWGDLTYIKQVKLYPLRSMLYQISRIRGLLGKDFPWVALSTAFPQLFEMSLDSQPDLFVGSVENRLVDLYRRYCSEWAALPIRLPRQDALQLAEVA